MHPWRTTNQNNEPWTPVFSFGIAYRRKQLWLSELAAIIFVALTLSCLSAFGIAALLTENRILNNNRRLWQLKTERLLLTTTLEQLREQALISSTLTEFGRGRLSRQTTNLLVDLIYSNSRTYGYDPLLMLAVVHVESYFQAEALGQYRSGSYSGALGLMQLKFETAQEVAKDLGIALETAQDVLVPEINIALGIAYLTRLIAQFNSLKLGILAYNQGPGVINESLSGRRPLSQDYYYRVLRSYYRLKEMHQKRLTGSSFATAG